MKKLIFTIALFTLFLLTSCEDNSTENPIEYERTIWVNPDVECCGVKDPLNNLGWLKELYTVYNSNFLKTTELKQPKFFFLFQNSITQENFVVIDIQGEYSSWIHIYDCRGSQIDGGVYNTYYPSKNSGNTFFYNVNATPPPPCNTCEEFFKTNALTDTIAYFIIKPKN